MKQKRYGTKAIAIGVLLASAAFLMVLSGLELLRNPARSPFLETSTYGQPNISNVQLNYLRLMLAPLDQHLPAEAMLSYDGEEALLAYFQAVMAPRRIAPDLNSPYMLVYTDAGESLESRANQHDARLLFGLASNIGLLLRNQ